MTIQEFYDWAIRNNATNFPIRIEYICSDDCFNFEANDFDLIIDEDNEVIFSIWRL